MPSNIPYQNLISNPPNLTLAEFTLSNMMMEKFLVELPGQLRQQPFFTANAFAVLLHNAFSHLHHNFPIFHRPTMQLDTFPAYLTLAIARLGALLRDDRESQQFGLVLHNYVRDVMFSVCSLPFANYSRLCFRGIGRCGCYKRCY